MQICSILRFCWSILVKCCVHLLMSSSKTQMLLLQRRMYMYPTKLPVLLQIHSQTFMSKAKPMDNGVQQPCRNTQCIQRDMNRILNIESSHTELIRQMYQTVLEHFDLGTCLPLQCDKTIVQMCIHRSLHGMSCSVHNKSKSLELWHITLH